MDERQAQIQTGAGLTESRLNVEFIDALKKWGPWLIILVAGVVLVYAGIGRLRASRERALTDAFAALNDAQVAGNPSGLVAVAEAQASYPQIVLQARLSAADIWLINAARGTRPGAQPLAQDKGGDFAPEDLLKPEDRAPLLAQAREQYRLALDAAEPKPEWWIQRSAALYGLAAVAEAEGQLDEAKTYLERAGALAKAQELPKTAAIAQKRIDTISEAATMPALPAQADVQSAPKPVPPPAPPAPSIDWSADFLMGNFLFPPTPLLFEDAAPASPDAPAPAPAPGTP